VKAPCLARELYLGGRGWLELSRKILPQKPNMKTVIKLELATRQNHSLVLWQGNYKSDHYFALAVQQGRLEYRFNLGTGPAVIRSAVKINSGRPHSVVLTREGSRGTLIVDGGAVAAGNARGAGKRMSVRRAPVYLGGAPPDSAYLMPEAKLYKTGYKGCILNMRVENKKIVEDNSGLGGFGSDIDFTDKRLVKDWANLACLDQCFV